MQNQSSELMNELRVKAAEYVAYKTLISQESANQEVAFMISGIMSNIDGSMVRLSRDFYLREPNSALIYHVTEFLQESKANGSDVDSHEIQKLELILRSLKRGKARAYKKMGMHQSEQPQEQE